MNKFLIYILLILIFVSSCQGTKEPSLTGKDIKRITSTTSMGISESEGEPVFLVGGTEITSDELINQLVRYKQEVYTTPLEELKPIAQAMELNQFKIQTAEALKVALELEISNILLYQQAKMQLGDQIDETLDNAAESELKRHIRQFGSDLAKADIALEQIGLDQESFKEQKKREILSQWYISTLSPTETFIPYRKLKERYEMMKDDYFSVQASIEFQLIDIRDDMLEISDPNANREQYALDFAKDLYNKLKSGEDFAEMAKLYSHGIKKDNGGLWLPLNPSSLAKPFDIIAKESEKMNPGEISEPVKSQNHIFIIKLINKQIAGYEPFEKVQKQVRNAVLSDMYQNTAIEQLNEKIFNQLELSQTNKFIDYCLEKIYKISNQQ